MLRIVHRVNTLEQLDHVPTELGVELDLHAYGDRLVVHHDPFSDGPDFEDWLTHYRHAFVILNVKEEGIESRVATLCARHGVEDFFMLDLSFPALHGLATRGESRIAVRVSEFEPVEAAWRLEGKVAWVWLDVFS